MILVFFFAPLLFCLPLLHSATDDHTSRPICPTNFSCPNFGSFKYPFYNSNDTRCGLIRVKCCSDVREFQFGGRSYEIGSSPGYDSSFLVRDGRFQNLTKNKSCEALENNFTSPSPLLFSISIQPFITLFKCLKDPTNAAEMDAYFDPLKYKSYSICKDHNFYYDQILLGNTAIPSGLPHTCEVIQLPTTAPWATVPSDGTIFSLLSSQFSISFHLSTSCEECHKKEGQCQILDGQFQCLQPKKGRKLHLLILVSALSAGAVTILIAIMVCFKRKLGWSTKTNNHVNVEMFLKNHEFLAPRRYSYSQVKKMTNSFKVKLGQGGYGSVYKGALSDGNLVAVKVLSESKGNGEDFINEVASVGRTSHVNIVCLVGFCFEDHQRALIYEFMPNGSLERFIYRRASTSNSQLGWEKLHQIALGIARGLEYLHSGCNTRILHLDIKPQNILLDQDFCPKISDFGLAKLFPKKRSMISMSHMRGTPGYIAPELFSRNFGGVSHKSDVYSYGMVILEMVGGRNNIEVGVDHTSEIYFPYWIYKKVGLDEELGLHGIVSEEENEITRKMIIVGLWCIQTNPLSRPTITKVLEMLEGDLALLEIPPKPYLSSPSRSVGSSTTD